jgi:hypothetical protein
MFTNGVHQRFGFHIWKREMSQWRLAESCKWKQGTFNGSKKCLSCLQTDEFRDVLFQ